MHHQIQIVSTSMKGSAGSLGERVNISSAVREKLNTREDLRQQSKAAHDAKHPGVNQR